MNAEYLLDAIGQLDDELVREAERYRRPKARYGRLMGLAACFAVAVALGYVLTHLGMGGGAPTYSGGGNGAAPAGGSTAPSAADGADTPHEPEQPLGGSSPSSPSGAGTEASGNAANGGDDNIWVSSAPLSISVRLDEDRLLNSSFTEIKVLDELPEGCVELGRLRRLGEAEETGVPYTDDEDYVGCPVWLLADGPETFTLYVELPTGGYLASG